MNTPQLTDTIEKKLLSLIDSLETQSKNNSSMVDSKLYIQLADLYNFHKKFNDEAAILSRFIGLERADSQELMDIYARIEKATQLAKLIDDNPAPIELNKYTSGSSALKLVAISEDKDAISLAGKKVVTPRADSNKTPFSQKTHKVISVCAVCTGRTDHDEVIQVALELFSYTPGNSIPLQIIETYVGNRKTIAKISNDTQMQFNLKSSEIKSHPFDADKILSLFQQAEFAVSHNDAERERKLLAVLIPDIALIPWHSSQKDIPWTALGFKNNRLSQIAVSLKERAPRSSLERAIAIARILRHVEVQSGQTYLERLYNMQPIKPMKWTFELTSQHKKLKNAGLIKKLKIIGGVTLICLIGLITYLI